MRKGSEEWQMKGIEVRVGRPIADAETAVRHALTEAGFGVLTEIDVAAIVQAKLGVRRPPLKVLGACNPSLAQRALQLDPSLALVLPCNVVLEEESEGRTRVTIVDPRALLAAGRLSLPAELEALGDEAATALAETASKLSG
jgi:uncharacterized protein (DUF302 family)